MKEKILLDTDIGSDIDDSIALAYLLKHPDCEILGITTVSGESEIRAKMASVICRAAGKGEIPICPGIEQPLLVSQKQPTALQAGVLKTWDHDCVFPKGEAVEFMRQTIHKYPGEITLLAIGPMTNVALLFAADPEIPSLLKQLVMMCGVFTYGLKDYTCLSEWNARCDPHATAMVYNANVKRAVSVGLDVTTQVTMKKKDFRKTFASGVMKPLFDYSHVWDNEEGLITFHDPLAAAAIFDDRICGLKKGDVTVELESRRAEGLTYFDENKNGNDEVAMTVDSEKFFQHFIEIVER